MKNNIIIYDHETHPIWSVIYKQKFKLTGSTNGAYTYSEDIVKHHLPIIIEILNKQNKHKNILISTVSNIKKEIIPVNTDLIIEYIHESKERDLPRCIKEKETFPDIDFIYILSRKDLYEELINNGFQAIFIPMAIITKDFIKYAKNEKYQDKRVIYFGNKYLGKDIYFQKTRKRFFRKYWKFDEISYNRFNGGPKLDRKSILEIISKYKYGIGEGRCILEMNALGLKTLICAVKNQGLIMNESDFELQKANNFSDGKVWTFSQDIDICIDNFDKAIIKTVDAQDVVPILEKQLKDILL